MQWWPFLLALALPVQAGGPSQPDVTDPAGDVHVAAWVTTPANGDLQASVDLLGAWFNETEGHFRLTVHVVDLAATRTNAQEPTAQVQYRVPFGFATYNYDAVAVLMGPAGGCPCPLGQPWTGRVTRYLDTEPVESMPINLTLDEAASTLTLDVPRDFVGAQAGDELLLAWRPGESVMAQVGYGNAPGVGAPPAGYFDFARYAPGQTYTVTGGAPTGPAQPEESLPEATSSAGPATQAGAQPASSPLAAALGLLVAAWAAARRAD